MATGAEFFAQLEKRFNQLSAEEKLDKIVEYQKKLTALKEQGLSIYKVLIGDYVTSLDMNGAALTVMKLDEELKEMLDYDAKAPGLK